MNVERDVSRFSALLQPIRNLASNWSINIAQELEAYLDDLAEITISFDDGASNLNFAEAALLIQGSTCVYSKKVEFLHALVYQTLDFINDKRAAHEAMQGGNGAVNGKGDNDIDTVLHFTEYDFLDLNDHLVEAETIDLDDDADNHFTVDASLVARPPTSLVTSHGAQGRGGDSMDFRVSQASVHPSGALVLDQGDHTTFNKQLEMVRDHNGMGMDMDMYADGGGEVGGFNSDDDDGDMELETSFQAHMAHGAAGDGDMVLMTPGAQGRRPRPAPTPSAPSDPWEMLDPHSVGTAKMKPFKRGKTFTTPRPPQTRLGASAFVAAYDDNVTAINSATQFKNVYFSEFRYLHKAETRRRNAVKKEERKVKQAQRNSHSPIAMMFEYDDDGGSEDDEAFGASPGSPFDGGAAFGDVSQEGPSWFDNQDRVQGQDGQVTSFEDLCRQHMDTFLAGFERYAKETKLSKRVADWQYKLDPVLDEQELHPAFDIHHVGEEVIQTFPKNAEKTHVEMDFAELSDGKEQYEVCRMFLAMLQLANNGNVEIAETNDTDDFRVQLLTRQPAYQFNATDADVEANALSAPQMPVQAQVMQV